MSSSPAFRHQPGFSRSMDPKPNRLKGWEWTKLRKLWIMHQPTCQGCGKPGEHVHHIVPRCIAPLRTMDMTNLMTLCVECHRNVHNDAR